MYYYFFKVGRATVRFFVRFCFCALWMQCDMITMSLCNSSLRKLGKVRNNLRYQCYNLCLSLVLSEVSHKFVHLILSPETCINQNVFSARHLRCQLAGKRCWLTA